MKVMSLLLDDCCFAICCDALLLIRNSRVNWETMKMRNSWQPWGVIKRWWSWETHGVLSTQEFGSNIMAVAVFSPNTSNGWRKVSQERTTRGVRWRESWDNKKRNRNCQWCIEAERQTGISRQVSSLVLFLPKLLWFKNFVYTHALL